MKKLNLQKSAIFAILLLSTISTESFAKLKMSQKNLTNNPNRLSDPYYQIKSVSIRELTAEEQLEFIADLPVLEDSIELAGDQLKINRLPKIPPRPPEIKNPLNPINPKTDTDSETDTSEVNKGGVDLVAAGGGGNTPGISAIGGALDNVIMVVDKLAAIGQKIMPLIEKGRPVVTNNPMAAISVIPRLDTKDPVLHEMGGWSIPMSKHYKIAYSNGFGGEVVSFVYSISYQYGGEYLGVGKYLTGIRASARNIVVSFGFDLDASSQLVQLSNIGTTKNVVAGATVEISYTVKNWSRVNTTNEAFFIAGDGRLFKMD